MQAHGQLQYVAPAVQPGVLCTAKPARQQLQQPVALGHVLWRPSQHQLPKQRHVLHVAAQAK